MFCASGQGRKNRTLVGGKDFRSGYEGRERSGGIFLGDDGRAQRSVA